MHKARTRLATAILAAAWLSFTSQSSYAVEETKNTSATSNEVTKKTIKDYLAVSYLGMILGPRVNNPGNIYQPDNETGGDDGAKVLAKNYVDVLYKVSPDLAIGPMIYWTTDLVAEHHSTFKDPALKIKPSPWIKTAQTTLTADLRIGLPLSDAAKTNQLTTYFASLNNFSYDLPGSRWSVGILAFERYWAYNGPANEDAPVFELYFGPNISYKITPTLAWTYAQEFNYSSKKGDPGKVLCDGNDFETGVSWDVSETVNFSPVFDVKLPKPMLNTTTLVAYLTWKAI